MLSTDAGQWMTKQKAKVTKVWFNKNGIANIESQSYVYSNKKAAFLVHKPERLIKLIWVLRACSNMPQTTALQLSRHKV